MSAYAPSIALTQQNPYSSALAESKSLSTGPSLTKTIVDQFTALTKSWSAGLHTISDAITSFFKSAWDATKDWFGFSVERPELTEQEKADQKVGEKWKQDRENAGRDPNVDPDHDQTVQQLKLLVEKDTRTIKHAMEEGRLDQTLGERIGKLIESELWGTEMLPPIREIDAAWVAAKEKEFKERKEERDKKVKEKEEKENGKKEGGEAVKAAVPGQN